MSWFGCASGLDPNCGPCVCPIALLPFSLESLQSQLVGCDAERLQEREPIRRLRRRHRRQLSLLIEWVWGLLWRSLQEDPQRIDHALPALLTRRTRRQTADQRLSTLSAAS